MRRSPRNGSRTVVAAAHEELGAGKSLVLEPGRALVANAGVTLYRVESVKPGVAGERIVAVDGGMSDNLRPMLYGAAYEAAVADRMGAGGDVCTVVGKHCESGDVLARDVAPARPAARRRAGDPGHGRLRARDGQQLQRRAAAAGDLLLGRRRARGRPARDLRGPAWPRRLGSACSATAPSGPHSPSCSPSGPTRSCRSPGCARRSARCSRARGATFEEVLESSDLIVELIGGIEPAREYVLRAMRAGRHVVSANKQLLSQHGEELWACARENGVQLRFEGAVAGVVPVIRVLQESLAASRVERIHGIVNGTTNYILTEMAARGLSYEQALQQAQELGYAEADPTDDVTGRDAAAKMAILARLAFSTPVHLDQVVYEGIEHLTADDMEYAKELGLGLKLIGTAERIDSGISVRVHPAFLYAGHPLASVHGPFNAVTVESDTITEVTLSGPGAGGPQTATAVLGDVVSAMIPPASTPEPTEGLTVVNDVESAFYLHMEVADRPGVLAQVAELLGMQGASIRSVVQKGLGENARLVLVLHPLLESRFYAAVRLIGQLDFIRSAPRAIRVIDEEFT